MNEKIKDEIEKLKKIINKANFEYHTLDKPEIADYEYDMYLARLIKLEEEYPMFKTLDSPTNKVGGEVLKEFKKVEHKKPMMSLSNVFSIEEITKFMLDIYKKTNDCEFIFEEKLDGLAISLEYKDGLFISASTRGDGVVGEDVTENIKTIKTIPLRLTKQIDLIVRGEIFMPNSSFEKLNKKRQEEGFELFANPRNATAGTIRQLDSKIVAKRNLNNYIYTLVNYKDYGLNTQEEVLNFLKDLGFNVNLNYKIIDDVKKIEEVVDFFALQKKINNYQTDGIVIKLNNLLKGEQLGFTSKFPKSQTAYKFAPTMVLTKLLDIQLQVGRLGVITPVACLSPVLLDGSTISKATLHNFLYIKEKDIRIGDYVYIFKAGEIIPKVFGPEIKKRESNLLAYKEPTNCPLCKCLLKKEEDGIITYCLNKECSGKILGHLVYFCSRPIMNIQGLGDKQIALLYENNILKDEISIYNLEDKINQIMAIPGFGKKGIENILAEIKKSNTRPFKNLFASFGIKNVGIKTSDIITSNFKNIDNIINATKEQLMEVPEIGEEIAVSVYEFFKNEKNISLVNFYKQHGFNLKIVENNNIQLKGYVFAITGSFKNYKRDDIKDDIILFGGEYSDGVTKKTTHLICGEKPGSKHEIAKKNNVIIISEEEYEKMKEK